MAKLSFIISVSYNPDTETSEEQRLNFIDAAVYKTALSVILLAFFTFKLRMHYDVFHTKQVSDND